MDLDGVEKDAIEIKGVAPADPYQKIKFISEITRSSKKWESYAEPNEWLDEISSKINLGKKKIMNLFRTATEGRYLYYLSKCYLKNPDKWMSNGEITNEIGGGSVTIYRHVIDENDPRPRGYLKIIEKKQTIEKRKTSYFKLKKSKFSSRFAEWCIESIDSFPNIVTYIYPVENKNNKFAKELGKKISEAGIDKEKLKNALENLYASRTELLKDQIYTKVGTDEILGFIWNNGGLKLQRIGVFEVKKPRIHKLLSAL